MITNNAKRMKIFDIIVSVQQKILSFKYIEIISFHGIMHSI